MNSRDLLRSYVHFHNAGVVSGDFASMLELFANDAEIHFFNTPFGPCIGRSAIEQAFATNPPSDQLELLEVKEQGSIVTGIYGWLQRPGKIAGTIAMTIEKDRIKRLDIHTGH